MNFSFSKPITKEVLLEHHSQETYLEHYLGIPVKKKLVVSPLRKDSNPTASFYRNSSGDIIFKDFSGDFSGNFINVVMRIHNVGYYDAIKIIAKDFGIIENNNNNKKIIIKESTKKLENKKSADIKVEIQKFTESELKWWSKYGITEKILTKFNVYSCKTVFLNNNLFAKSTTNNMMFGYYGGKQGNLELWRIYFPLRKSFRFITNWSTKKIQGYKQLPKNGKLLVITKSMKDVMCLYSLGITAIAPNSETQWISDTILEDLKSKFKYIVVLFDNDLAGISSMNKIKKLHPELIYTWIPRELSKDISDFYKKFGRKETINFIKPRIEWLNKH